MRNIKDVNVNANLLALHLNAFFVAYPRRGHRFQRDEAFKRLKQLKHARIPHAHVYIIYSRHLMMLKYYYLLTLLFSVADLMADKMD